MSNWTVGHPVVQFPLKGATFDLCSDLTFLCDNSTQLPDSVVPQEPPLPLHPHLALRVVFLWDLRPDRSTTKG